ncbi:hypothetical protein Q0590_34825 [Rhodocytophaga aerolata]|uniref:DUF3575 domain-containing protein n=1 Tax=Rhodocytophaga aerolata TaxID=455078 RepID=A0ABT8RHB5_9BACT|nr:hypothetical protein [Rhodocytophaga aerolata]MDO1451501.1 hypothetical protein [Rhodocytophaga aerolata]
MLNYHTRLLAALIYLFLPCGSLQAQEKTHSLPISVSLLAETITLPRTKNVFNRLNPGIRIGTEFSYSRGKPTQWFQTLSLTYYRHKQLHDAFLLNTQVGWRRYVGNFYPEVLLGVGYGLQHSSMHRFTNSSKGTFEKASPFMHKLMPSLALGVGYRINTVTAVFTRYEFMAELPFVYNGNPLLPHQLLHTGVLLQKN